MATCSRHTLREYEAFCTPYDGASHPSFRAIRAKRP